MELVSQADYEAKRGILVAIHNTDDRKPLKVDSARLMLGVGDGKKWHEVYGPAVKWKTGHEYRVRVVMSGERIALSLDGKEVAAIKAAYLPVAQPEFLWFSRFPDWAKDETDYLPLQTLIRVKAGESGNVDEQIAGDARSAGARYLLNQRIMRRVAWKLQAGDKVEIEAAFQLVRKPTLKEGSPFVDRYGQFVYGKWEGKVYEDGDLEKALREEQEQLQDWGEPLQMDSYGGRTDLGWNGKPTGFFHVEQRNGFWWLITPEGHPCVYTGLCGAPCMDKMRFQITNREPYFRWVPPKGEYGSGVEVNDPGDRNRRDISFDAINRIRKYGPDWRTKSEKITLQRLRAWGFSGVGKWDQLSGACTVAVIWPLDMPRLNTANIWANSRLDVWDEAMKE